MPASPMALPNPLSPGINLETVPMACNAVSAAVAPVVNLLKPIINGETSSANAPNFACREAMFKSADDLGAEFPPLPSLIASANFL